MKHSKFNFGTKIVFRYLIATALLLSILEGCKKEDDSQVNVTPNEKNSADAYRIIASASYKGLYIDNFDDVVGDSAEENSLLRWCVRYKFNALSLYDTKALLLTKSSYGKLAAFIKKSRTQYGIKSVAAIRSIGIQFTGSTTTYNKSRKDTLERFNVFNLENEWWNNGTSCDFSCYQSHLITMNNAAHSANPKIKSEEFMGWFLNPAGNELAQATALVQNSDRIMMHEYWASPNFEYNESRLAFIGAAAKNLNKVMDVIIIFSAEPDFMYNYFDKGAQNKTFDDAYASIVAQHNASLVANKNFIRIIGYQIFDQSWARRARP